MWWCFFPPKFVATLYFGTELGDNFRCIEYWGESFLWKILKAIEVNAWIVGTKWRYPGLTICSKEEFLDLEHNLSYICHLTFDHSLIRIYHFNPALVVVPLDPHCHWSLLQFRLMVSIWELLLGYLQGNLLKGRGEGLGNMALMELCHWHWLQLQHHLVILDPWHRARNVAEGDHPGLGKNSSWLLLVNLFCNATLLVFPFVTDDTYLKKLKGWWVRNFANPSPSVIWSKAVFSWIFVYWFYMLTCYYHHDYLNEQWQNGFKSQHSFLYIINFLVFNLGSQERCIFF